MTDGAVKPCVRNRLNGIYRVHRGPRVRVTILLRISFSLAGSLPVHLTYDNIQTPLWCIYRDHS